MIREGDGTGCFLHRKEGVTQEDPLAMIAYGLRILPLIWYLRTDHPGVTQPWYAGEPLAGGTLDEICKHLYYLMLRGPPQRYFPDPTKRILVVSPRNVPRSEAFFCGYGLKIETGGRSRGGFVGSEAAQDW